MPPINLLLVEDNPPDVELIQAKLDMKSDRHSILLKHVESLEDALELLAKTPFDVVLLDLGLGDSEGLETLERTLNSPHRAPVIVLTGLDDEGVALQAVQAGAQDYLVKDEFGAPLLHRSIHYAIERSRLETERLRLHKQLVTIIEDEQQRIARELHDEVGQSLSGLNMLLRSLNRKLRESGFEDLDLPNLISEGIQDILDSFRRVLNGLSPVDIDRYGLSVALQRLCEDADELSDTVSCNFQLQNQVSVEDNTLATNLYRIAQESLNNSWKHAASNQIRVSLQQDEEVIRLIIEDDGKGFDTEDSFAGRGLGILRHRAEMIGGVLDIRSSRQGTTIECKVDVNGSQ